MEAEQSEGKSDLAEVPEDTIDDDEAAEILEAMLGLAPAVQAAEPPKKRRKSTGKVSIYLFHVCLQSRCLTMKQLEMLDFEFWVILKSFVRLSFFHRMLPLRKAESKFQRISLQWCAKSAKEGITRIESSFAIAVIRDGTCFVFRHLSKQCRRENGYVPYV